MEKLQQIHQSIITSKELLRTHFNVKKNFDLAQSNIKKEVEDAKKTFAKYKWPTIDVTRKSVEETAASIIKIHEIYKNNE